MSGAPRVTIVMTARERHDLAVTAVQSVVDNTERPYRFIYVECGSPAWLGETLARRAGEWGLEVVQAEPGLWPHHIRKRMAPSIDTEYVVFIDNDVAVRAGWLERLVACADETGAGMVGPLTLIGAGATTGGRIHMGGGRLTAIPTAGGMVLEEVHCFADRFPEEVASDLKREPSDYLEYHCMLMRTKLAREVAPFDEAIVCVHEHIDTSLTARKAGYELYFEPAVVVTYLALNPYKIETLPFFRSRWDRAASEASIKAFCAKWNVVDDERSFGGVRYFLERHRAMFDPIRQGAQSRGELRRAMAPQELRQTISGLAELAASRGYNAGEWSAIERGYRAAMVLFNGAFRPGGRPFINHLAGTASVLMHYELNHAVVVAGLLHAAYTHCPHWAGDPRDSVGKVAGLLGGEGKPEEVLVRGYTRRVGRARTLLQSPRPSSEVTTSDAAVLAIAASTEVDMHLSGEFRYSGHRDLEPQEILALLPAACGALGISGLADTIERERRTLAATAPNPGAASAASFRLEGDRMVPATNAAVCAALERVANAA